MGDLEIERIMLENSLHVNELPKKFTNFPTRNPRNPNLQIKLEFTIEKYINR